MGMKIFSDSMIARVLLEEGAASICIKLCQTPQHETMEYSIGLYIAVH